LVTVIGQMSLGPTPLIASADVRVANSLNMDRSVRHLFRGVNGFFLRVRYQTRPLGIGFSDRIRTIAALLNVKRYLGH